MEFGLGGDSALVVSNLSNSNDRSIHCDESSRGTDETALQEGRVKLGHAYSCTVTLWGKIAEAQKTWDFGTGIFVLGNFYIFHKYKTFLFSEERDVIKSECMCVYIFKEK